MKNPIRSLIVFGLVATLAVTAHAAEIYTASGRINRVDRERGEVNVTHGPIAELGWPGMTMTFPVADKTATRSLKAGEAVRFWLEKRDAHYVIIKIEPVNTAK